MDSPFPREQREAQRLHRSANQALCVEAVTEWNRLMERRYKPRWSPSIGVAISAQFHWLDVLCPGCRQLKQVDLRALDRHPQTTLYGLIPKLSCRSCRPSPPFAVLVRLSERKWENPHAPAYMPKRS